TSQRIIFLPDSTKMAVLESGTRYSIYSLPSQYRPAEDAVSMSRLLTSQFSTDGEPSTEMIRRLWQSLRIKYPSDFTVTPENSKCWHEREAASAEEQKAWAAALFHLEWLRQLEPDNAELKRRFEN